MIPSHHHATALGRSYSRAFPMNVCQGAPSTRCRQPINKPALLPSLQHSSCNTTATFWALQTFCNVGQLLLLACHALRQLGHHTLSRRFQHTHPGVQNCLLLFTRRRSATLSSFSSFSASSSSSSLSLLRLCTEMF